MLKFSCYCKLPLIALVLFPLAGIELIAARPMVAQSHIAQSQTAASSEKFGGFFAPKGQGMPQQSQGGASRGACFGDASSLEHGMNLITLITPGTNQGLSVAARPTLLAHVPPSAARQVYFSLKNEDESYFYEQTATLNASGILKFQVPEEAPALEVGEQYRWSVALICGTRLSPDSPWASGWVERTDGESALKTEAMTPMDQASAYGRAGLWYDTIATLFTMVETQSSAPAAEALNQLLVAEGLAPVSMAVKSLAVESSAVESLALSELTDKAEVTTGVVQP